MRTISQRELRNDNAAIVRQVEAGQTFTVTRRGVPVARLSPIESETVPRCVRPARKRLDPAALCRTTSDRATDEVLTDLRGER